MSAARIRPEQRAARTKRKREAAKRDRALCPVEVASILGISVRRVAETMRAVGVAERLTAKDARLWRKDPTVSPFWLRRLLRDVEREREAAREERDSRQRLRAERERQAMYEAMDRVAEKLLAGKKIRSENELEALDAIAWRALKDTGGGEDWTHIDDVGAAALALYGYDDPRPKHARRL